MVGWFCIWFFLENKTPCAGLRGSGLKSIFQLKALLEINYRSSLRIFAFSSLSLTIAKTDVSSPNSFALDFTSPGKSRKKKKRTKKLIKTNIITRYKAIAMSRDLQLWRSSFSLFKHIYYFQFLIFEIIRFAVWFYVLSVIFPRRLTSLIFVSLICF